jgi:4'-phosphopantetheinyl transferase
MFSFLHIWQANLASPLTDWPAAEAALSEVELARQARLRTPALRQTYGRAHAFMRAVLAFYSPKPAHALSFATGPQGKPVLLGSELHFNLSYRAERALLAVSDAGPVGADVEQLLQLPGVAALVKELYSAEEQVVLRTTNPAAYWPFFFTIWTRKEAYAKALGMGLTLPFAEFSVLTLAPDTPPQLTAPAGACLYSFAVGMGYQGAVALLEAETAPAPQYFWYPVAL